MITLYPISKLVSVIAGTLYWYLAWKDVITPEFSSSSDPGVNLYITLAFGMLRAYCVTLSVAVLLFIASGWGIVCNHLLFTRKIFIIFSLLWIFIFQTTEWVWNVGIRLLELGIFFIVFKIFIYTMENKNLLELQIGDPDSNVVGVHMYGINVVQSKLSLYRIYPWTLVFYYTAKILIIFTGWFYDAWITVLLLELTDILLFIAIGYFFRLRDNNVFYRLDGIGGMNFSEEQSLVPHDNPAQEPILIHGPRVGEAAL